jgi:2C-methyl-D-erythritol 2,4-cyclodiphosphate synthase
MSTTALYRLEILPYADHGGDYWVWVLRSSNGDYRAHGRVDALAGTYDLGDSNQTMEADRVAAQVCRDKDIRRDDVAMAIL